MKKTCNEQVIVEQELLWNNVVKYIYVTHIYSYDYVIFVLITMVTIIFFLYHIF